MRNKRIRSGVSILLSASMFLALPGCMKRDPFGPRALENYAKENGAEVFDDARDFSHTYKDLYGDFSEIEDGICVRARGDDVEQALDFTDELAFFYNEKISEAAVYITGDIGRGHYSECLVCSMGFDVKEDARYYYNVATNMYTVPIEFDYDEMAQYDPYLASSLQENEAKIKELEDEMIEELRNSGMSEEGIEEWIDMFNDIYEVDNDLVIEYYEKDGLEYTLLHGLNGNVYYTAGIYLRNRTVFYVYAFGTDEDTIIDYVDEVCEAFDVDSPSILD